jgi:hypothetical protein
MKQPTIWIGRWLVGVALLHTLFGLAMGAPVLAGLARRGVFDSVGNAPLPGMVVWFLLFGAILALLGMSVTMLERGAHFHGARGLGIGTALLGVAGVILMPVSGFWLVFPPAIALMRRRTGSVPA